MLSALYSWTGGRTHTTNRSFAGRLGRVRSGSRRLVERLGVVRGAPRENSEAPAVAGRRHPLVLVAATTLFLAGSLLLLKATNVVGGQETVNLEWSADVSHVHGIAINPADGRVYVGTHRGVFQLSEQRPPVPIAKRAQDYMGLTAVGPDRFLASGHPGQGSSASVGLIESTNAGETWKSRSLEGRADFHSLEARHGLVFGYDYPTGELMVTDDLEVWETRSHIAIGDFDVSPEDPNLVVGVTAEGVIRSQDGGRSFTAPAGPVLLLVSWADDGALVGLTPDGTIHFSDNGGRSWDRRGTIEGAAEAVEAASAQEVYAAVDRTVFKSRDGGRTFAPMTP
jgi:hypothetical protein